MKIRSVLSLFALFLVSLTLSVSCTASHQTSTLTNYSTNPSASSPIHMGFNS